MLQKIHASKQSDLAAIGSLYPQAFPDEDLVPLVRALLNEPKAILSLVATVGSALVGHVLFTKGSVTGSNGLVALLGPLAVSPSSQRRGIGSALVRAGLEQLQREGFAQVFVLGDPAYYGRFGFATESNVSAPYELPPEWATAWQSVILGSNTGRAAGSLVLPQPWMQPALWAP